MSNGESAYGPYLPTVGSHRQLSETMPENLVPLITQGTNWTQWIGPLVALGFLGVVFYEVRHLDFVLLTSLVIMLLRNRLFSLAGSDLRYISYIHAARILFTTAAIALMWHLILPEVDFRWWLLLASGRLLISRLPFLPNKDIMFAALAVVIIGHDSEITELIALITSLLLMTHLVMATILAVPEIIRKRSKESRK